ncbi:MAG TPA: flagellar protein FlbB [Pseudolabrys sp.]|nr:flagellar protein FlbB [Pseudolabrys sp.]
MLRFLPDVRLLPIVLLATGALFVLKTMGIVLDGGYTLGERLASRGQDTLTVTTAPPAGTRLTGAGERQQQSWAAQAFNFPDVTGSVPDTKKQDDKKPDDKKKDPAADLPLKVSKEPPPPQPVPDASGVIPNQPPSPGERAILERLGDRRHALEERNREIEMRESLLKAAEQRMESRANELKSIETRINATLKQRDEADTARFKSLVTMYENMKAKDAARIFDRLDMRILVDVATQMNPRRLADVLAAMTSEAAEKLTVELARRAGGSASASSADLPKIEGRPAER